MDNRKKLERILKKLDVYSLTEEQATGISDIIEKKIPSKRKQKDGIILLFEKIFEHFPYAIAICDEKGRIIKTNKFFIDLFEGEPKSDFCIFDNPVLKKAGYGNLLAKARKGKYVEIPELWVDLKDSYSEKPSCKVCIKSIVFPIYNKKKIENFVLIIEDISDKKKIEAQLQENEKRYRSLFESSRDAIMTLAPPLWNFNSGNSSTFQMFLAKDEVEFTSKEPWVLSPEYQPDGKRSIDKAKEMIETAMQKGSHFFEWTHKRLNGEEFPATVLLTRMENNEKKFLQATVRDITQQKLDELVLKESEEKYREIFENATEMIWTSDLKGNIITMNPAMEKLLGYKSEDLDIINFRYFLTKDSFQRATENIKYKIEHPGVPTIYEIEAIAKDDSHVFFEVSSFLKFKKNQPYQIFGIARDITERKRAEDELNKTRKKYMELFDATNDIIYTMDFKGNFTSVNKTAEKLLGLKFDELTNVNMKSYLTPESARRALSDVVKKLRGQNENTIYEVDFIKKNGGIVTFEINSQIRYKKEKPYEVFGIARDVTERKKASEALRLSEEKYRMIFENAPLGIMTADISGNIIEINPVLLQMLGSKSVQETKNINVLSFPPMIMAGLVEKFVKCIETGEPVISEHTYTSKWGKSLDTRIYTKPIKNSRGKITGFQTIVEDITEQKETEKQIKSALNEKEVLIREIHHRVKNNMQIIISLINMQMHDSKDTVLIRKFRDLQHRVRSMSIIHEDLYMSDDLSRINFGNYLERLTNHLLQAYPHNKNLQLKFNVSNILLGIDTAIPCGLIVNEILSNSLKYAFPDDCFGSEKSCEIFIEFSIEKNSYKLLISDNGIGLPPNIEEIKSKSLGLLLVEILVTQLKGKMKMYGNKGTRYEIEMEKEKEKK